MTRARSVTRAIWSSLILTLAVIGLLSPRTAVAQVDQGAIIGVVTDSSGAVIPNAQVTVTETDTGLVLKAKTNGSGNYFFSPIKIGNYTVSASAPGFQTTEEKNVAVHVQDRLNIPLHLQPGKVNETVVVTSTAPLMQTQTAEVAMDVDSKFLNDAPLANRNWIFIAQEAPGITPEIGRGAGNGDFSSNGQHEEQNNYQLDGVDNNVANSDYINGSSYNLAPPPDAIQEFKLETSNYSAELGRGHGAVFNATTKSGTNQFHGDLWEYVRNTAFDSLVWNQAPGSKVAVFHMNQFGATLGGPIIKNHLFFFGDVQEQRFVNGANPTTYSVPTPRERRGDFSELLNPTWGNGTCPIVLYVPNTNGGNGQDSNNYYKCASNSVSHGPTGSLQQYGNSQYTYSGYTFAPGQNVFSPTQIDPVAQKLLQEYPCPNYASAGQPNFGKPNGGWSTGDCNSTSDVDQGPTSNNYQTNLTTTSDPINWDGKLDWNISSRDLATFRVDYAHFIQTNPSPLGPILDGYPNYAGHNQSYLSENFMLSETHTFSQSLINEFRFGFNYGNDSNLQYNYNANIAATLGLNGVPVNLANQEGGLPSVADGFTTFGTHGNDPAHEGMNIYQFLDNVTKVIGNHSLKAGVEINPGRWYSTNAGQPLGSYSYNGQFTGVTAAGGPTGNGAADFLALGTLAGGGYTNTNNMASGQLTTFVYTHFVQKYNAAYAQDDWKVTPKLTLNLGLRYEYFTPKREQANQLANFVQLGSMMTSNGAVSSAELVMPQADSSQTLPANFLALLNADNVKVVYTSNPYLTSFPKFNWSPRVGAAYQFSPQTVGRIGGGLFMGGFEPGGGAANILNPPFIVTAATAALPSCSQGSYCESQYAFGNTLEGGLGQFMGPGGVANHAAFPQVSEEDPNMHMPYTINYNVSVEQVLTPTTTMTLSYVGSLGRHLVTSTGPNLPMAITVGGEQPNGFQQFPHLGGYAYMQWTAASNYNSLQAQVQKRYASGLAFLATYTWAHGFSDESDLLGGDVGYKSPYIIPIRNEYTQSGQDIRNRAVINVDYDLPFGEGRRFVNQNRILDKIIGGWKTDMEWWGQTGQPFTIGINRISGWGNANGGTANSAIKIANPFSTGLPAPNVGGDPARQSGITNGTPSNTAANVCAAQTHTRTRWYNPCAFEDPIGVMSNNAAGYAALAPYATGYFSYYSPAIGPDSALNDGAYNNNGTLNTLGPAPYVTGYPNVAPFFGSTRNDLSGPGNWRLNASIFKDFKVWREGTYLELRADAFNVLNHPSFGNPGGGTNIGANSVALTGPGSNQANTIDSRFLQFSGKFVF
ncbi:MAG TPA: TonB-dependent receptor [Acidobacteriaceae bacterium]|nr:TonB-dependent receptor [Acidobacteriaceae bacterium]